jgi:hypothetical protein
MATQEERLALQEASKRYTGKDFGVGGFDQAFEDSGVSATNRIREILNSSEAQQYGQQLASNQFTPQISQVDQAAAQSKSELDTLIGQLQEQQKAAPEQTFNDFNRRGLFRSSMAQKAVANTVGQLGSQIGNAQIQRSTRLADLAAQRASLLNKQTQYANDFTSGNRSAFEQNVAEQEAAQQKMQHEQQLQQLKLQTALAQASRRGGSDSGKSPKPETSGLSTTNYNSAYNSALSALEDADVSTAGTQDRFLSADERSQAEDQIRAIAGSYGIDPQELFDKVWGDNQFRDYIPGTFAGIPKTYARVTGGGSKSSGTSGGGSFIDRG